MPPDPPSFPLSLVPTPPLSEILDPPLTAGIVAQSATVAGGAILLRYISYSYSIVLCTLPTTTWIYP